MTKENDTVQIDAIEADLATRLTPAKYRHTLGVCYTACALAMRFGADVEQARLAGLLHDCAKSMSAASLLAYCSEHDIEVSRAEAAHPPLLHAKVGASLAKEQYGIQDAAVLSAIRYHTTGHPGMTLLEQIVYLADYIEPNRSKAPNLDALRMLSFEDRDKATGLIAQQITDYLRAKGAPMDPLTEEVAKYYA